MLCFVISCHVTNESVEPDTKRESTTGGLEQAKEVEPIEQTTQVGDKREKVDTLAQVEDEGGPRAEQPDPAESTKQQHEQPKEPTPGIGEGGPTAGTATKEQPTEDQQTHEASKPTVNTTTSNKKMAQQETNILHIFYDKQSATFVLSATIGRSTIPSKLSHPLCNAPRLCHSVPLAILSAFFALRTHRRQISSPPVRYRISLSKQKFRLFIANHLFSSIRIFVSGNPVVRKHNMSSSHLSLGVVSTLSASTAEMK